MFSILDGREHFYQWDTNRKLVVADGSIDKVHFCNRTGSCALVRCVYEVNGTYLVDVPNVILQNNYRVNVYGYDREYTKHSAAFTIVARTKPEDYVNNETEYAQWEALEERISQIEENGVSDATIAAAVETYLTENPISGGATEEQVSQIAANTEAITALNNELENYYTKSETDKLLEGVGTGGSGADLSNYYTKGETDSKLSNYATHTYVAESIRAEAPDLTGFATQSWVEGKKYLTEHQSLADYALKSEISGFQTAEQVAAAINTAIAAIVDGEEVSY